MGNNYKLQKKGLEGKIIRAFNYVVGDHVKSFGYTAAGLFMTGVSCYSVNAFIDELNGVVPMDPESPMFIPAALGTIFAFGAFANAIRYRVMENRALREEYARYFHEKELEREIAEMEAEKARKNAFFTDYRHNQAAIENLEDGNHKTR